MFMISANNTSNRSLNLPMGAYELTVKDVPVDAFWSISLYNKDGSFTVHFGGDPKSLSYLHIMEGWNYTVRLYQPRNEILEGKWVFPDVKSVQ